MLWLDNIQEYEQVRKDIQDKIQKIRRQIQITAKNCNRDPNSIQLLLVTKNVPAWKIQIALELGERLIGENRVQELKEKHESLKHLPHTTHFIGRLQSNKIKDAIRYANCIQSIDNKELAEKIQRKLEEQNKTIQAFIQINTSGETTKQGISPEEALELAKYIKTLDRIQLTGLMTIGIHSTNLDEVRMCFRRLKQVQEILQNHGYPILELSMGMSSDFSIAIEEGSTMVRIGTAIFGSRS